MIGWFSWKGRMSARQYRVFLLYYFLFFVPFLIVLLGSLFIIGARSPTGLIRAIPILYLMATSVFVALLAFVPLLAATVRRIHDLGLRGRDVILTYRPQLPKDFGKKMLFDSGDDYTTIHGKNPGRYEE